MNHPAPSPDGSLLCVNLLMKGRQWFIAASLLTILCMNLLEPVAAQTWSEPVKIAENAVDAYPDLTVDNRGVIHCVWTRTLTYETSRIYYSKSTDNGSTWTQPVPITKKSDVMVDFAHIVADTSGNLYVLFEYDTFGWTRICYVTYDGATSLWSSQTQIGSGSTNSLLIDKNEKVYFFWYHGTVYYRCLENNILSDSIAPYPGLPCAFRQVAVDNDNVLYGVGNFRDNGKIRGGYCMFAHGYWSPFKKISNPGFMEVSFDPGMQGEPSFAYCQYLTNAFDTISTYFSKVEGDTLTTPTLLASNTYSVAIVIDNKNQPHIVEGQKTDSGYQIIHHFRDENSWYYEVLEKNEFDVGECALTRNNSHLYLVYNRVDKEQSPIPLYHYVGIIFRKMEILSGINDNYHKSIIKIFPNPSHDRIVVNIPPGLSDKISVKIFDPAGNLCYERHNLVILPNTREFTIDFNETAPRLNAGSYIIHITDGNHSFSTKIIRDQ